VEFFLLFCLFWIAIDVVLWLVDHPAVFWFWTISGLIIGGIVWLYNQTTFSVSQQTQNWIGFGVLGALCVFGIWQVIVGARTVFRRWRHVQDPADTWRRRRVQQSDDRF
jgi:uncharacterized membrane protein